MQSAHPGLGSVGDVDPAEAWVTRHRLLAEFAGTDDLLLGTRFPHPTGGRVQRRDSRFQLQTDPPALLAPGPLSGRQPSGRPRRSR